MVYLAAAVIFVPLAKRLGLGSVLGYLVAGCVDRPVRPAASCSDVESILHFAEFGVVLMLFLIGLELEPKRLWAHAPRGVRRRRAADGWRAARAARRRRCALRLAVAGALVAGLALALSSTAIAVQTMSERNLLDTPHRAQQRSPSCCSRTSPRSR